MVESGSGGGRRPARRWFRGLALPRCGALGALCSRCGYPERRLCCFGCSEQTRIIFIGSGGTVRHNAPRALDVAIGHWLQRNLPANMRPDFLRHLELPFVFYAVHGSIAYFVRTVADLRHRKETDRGAAILVPGQLGAAGSALLLDAVHGDRVQGSRALLCAHGHIWSYDSCWCGVLLHRRGDALPVGGAGRQGAGRRRLRAERLHAALPRPRLLSLPPAPLQRSSRTEQSRTLPTRVLRHTLSGLLLLHLTRPQPLQTSQIHCSSSSLISDNQGDIVFLRLYSQEQLWVCLLIFEDTAVNE